MEQVRAWFAATRPTCAEATQIPSFHPPLHPNTGTRQVPRSDCSLNMVIFGIPESMKGTPRHVRSADDLTSVTKLDASILEFFIRIWCRLEKFFDPACSHHPVLGKFNQVNNVSRVLSKRISLPPCVVIILDKTPEQCLQEAVLLTKRWHFIHSGTSREEINSEAASCTSTMVFMAKLFVQITDYYYFLVMLLLLWANCLIQLYPKVLTTTTLSTLTDCTKTFASVSGIRKVPLLTSSFVLVCLLLSSQHHSPRWDMALWSYLEEGNPSFQLSQSTASTLPFSGVVGSPCHRSFPLFYFPTFLC